MNNITQINQHQQFSLQATNLQEAMQIADILSKSQMVPREYQGRPNDVLVTVQMGAELGLKPLQSLQNIACINGKPSIYGDAAKAIVEASPQCLYIKESFEESTMTATCITKRRGRPDETITTFSRADAEVAKLWGKQGPWSQYPKRMLQMRARGFALRDTFPDLLKGLITAEEAQDYGSEREINPRQQQQPQQNHSRLAERMKKNSAPRDFASAGTNSDKQHARTVETQKAADNVQSATVPTEVFQDVDSGVQPPNTAQQNRSSDTNDDAPAQGHEVAQDSEYSVMHAWKDSIDGVVDANVLDEIGRQLNDESELTDREKQELRVYWVAKKRELQENDNFKQLE